jgi:uncharacterized membrane protein HdeD (DUF308 family)
MDASVVDFPALLLATVIAVAIATSLLRAFKGENTRRAWIAAGVLAAVLLVLGVVDLLRESPRETHISTPLVGATLPVLGALGMVRGTRRVRMRFRWPLVFVTAFALLFGGLLIGATLFPRFFAF